MTVHFIGAGPGAPDLITVRGLRLLAAAPVVMYAGSLVSEALIEEAKAAHTIINTTSMTLDQIIETINRAHIAGESIARVHSGDPSLYGAIAEQMHRLEILNIDYDVTPGVAAFSATAARLKQELTLPTIAQTVILTRTTVRASKMPLGEDLEQLAKTGATIAIHLSINNLAKVVRELMPYYGRDCPTVIAYRVTWPDEIILKGTLNTIRDKVKSCDITRTALILVGKVLDKKVIKGSSLYDASHTHIFRPN